ncbi:septum site-determining protein MinC [Lentilactobacillus laojiaonis]|uniref:septum site-determining protein MinC n=1 Tax=Lentilactobacillus laojiaonis TaxID=2883998 RepID=UPI001D0BE238|nr:septum site-determining protein MinC [Lentilactobacillus laojiaonis]UDM31728.1 cell division inhibitor [Lentilactobacillus laojiaonis]
MQDAAVLKGTNDGYELVLDERASMNEIFSSLSKLLDKLKTQTASVSPKAIKFDVLTGNRLLTSEDRKKLEEIFSNYEYFSIHKVLSEVISNERAEKIRQQENVHVVDRIIRNGQDVHLEGDVIFLGTVHQGGKLFVSGNLYVMGNVHGIVQAGYPNIETKLIIGDLHNAQQVRIGEQFEILDDVSENNLTRESVVYVNDLHVIDYGKIEDLKRINPKFFNMVGGVING